MNMIKVDLLALDSNIASLKNCAKKGRLLERNYRVKQLTDLDFSKGYEKEEIANNYNKLLDLVTLLSELMEKTSNVLESAKQNYLNNDEKISDRFKL